MKGSGLLKITLEEKELFYLSALMGIDNIWGLEDPFANEDDATVITEILSLQNVLVGKGCLNADIDGKITVSTNYGEILEVCAGSEQVYILNSSHMEEERLVLRYFVHDRMVVQYTFNGLANLEVTSFPVMRAEIETFFGDADDEENPSSLLTGVARMRRMGSLSRQRFLQELRSTGCEEKLALLIADGLLGKAEFCSLLAFERKAGNERLSNKIVTLRFAGGSLIVTPGDGNVDMVCFSRLSHDKLDSQLNSIFGQKAVDVI